MEFFRFAKYDSKGDARLQEGALDVIKEAAEKHGLTLGEVKTPFYIASRDGMPAGILGAEVHELLKVQRCRERLNAGYFTSGLAILTRVET